MGQKIIKLENCISQHGEYLFKVIGDKYLYVKYTKLILVQTRKSKLANSIFMTLGTFETTLRLLISGFY